MNFFNNIIKGLIRVFTARWQPYTKLFLLSDSPGWSIAHDMQEIAILARKLGLSTVDARFAYHTEKQSLFLGSHFDLLLNDPKWLKSSHRLGTSYFHGKPNTGVDEFDLAYKNLTKHHQRISRIHVSCNKMRELVLSSNIEPDKVHLIPIGINSDNFTNYRKSLCKQNVRLKYGIPLSAIVVGSFQKDGIGWGEGNEPKHIKGPDIFLKAISILKQTVPELFVLLSGPARGFVKNGLERLSVPYKHIYQNSYKNLINMYGALDLYIISSREEGGPKAVLESMASGVPLVSTRVGQGEDLIVHGENGWMVDIEDSEGLAYWAEYALNNSSYVEKIKASARITAERFAYSSQIRDWKKFMDGFCGKSD